MSFDFRRRLTVEFFRYFCASLAGLGVDFSLYTGLTALMGWHYLASAAAGFAAGVVAVYLLSIFWVFTDRRYHNRAQEFSLFVVIGMAGLALTEFVLYVFTDLAGLDYRASKVVAAGCVFTFNFICRKLFLFSGLDNENQG